MISKGVIIWGFNRESHTYHLVQCIELLPDKVVLTDGDGTIHIHFTNQVKTIHISGDVITKVIK